MAQKLELIDGSIMVCNGKEVYEAVLSGVVKQVDIKNRKMSMIGTDESVDRDGDIIQMSGWKLENYKKNPVFLWAHNYGSVPLARAEKIVKKQDPKVMQFDLKFPSKDLHPFADMILELYNEQMINASSVGFIPMKWEDITPPDEDKGKMTKGQRRTWGRKYTDQELLELSGCAVPANPNALQNALKGKSFMNMPFAEIQKWLQGKAVPPRPKYEDDILGELGLGEAEFVDEGKSVQVQVPLAFCEIVDETKEIAGGVAQIPDEVFENLPGNEKIKEEKKDPECPAWDGKIEGLEVPPYDEKDAVKSEDVMKPYPNEHACRLEDPGQFDRFARKNCFRKHDNKCMDFIFGYPKDGGGKLQAIRYGKEIWTSADAKKECQGHKGTFEAASGASIDGGSLTIELTPYKRMEDIFGFLKAMDEKFTGSLNDLLEAIKSLKPVEADPAKTPSDPSLADGKNGKATASETILAEAFIKGKETKPIPLSLIPPAKYGDVTGVLDALKELGTQIQKLIAKEK
jgi:hypothetical protein